MPVIASSRSRLEIVFPPRGRSGPLRGCLSFKPLEENSQWAHLVVDLVEMTRLGERQQIEAADGLPGHIVFDSAGELELVDLGLPLPGSLATREACRSPQLQANHGGTHLLDRDRQPFRQHLLRASRPTVAADADEIDQITADEPILNGSGDGLANAQGLRITVSPGFGRLRPRSDHVHLSQEIIGA